MVQGATRHFEENQQKAASATLCVSNSVFYFNSDRFNVSAKLRSGVMRVSNVPPASSITRGWRFNRFRIDSERFRNVQSLSAGYSPYKNSPPSSPPSAVPLNIFSTGCFLFCTRVQKNNHRGALLYGLSNYRICALEYRN